MMIDTFTWSISCSSSSISREYHNKSLCMIQCVCVEIRGMQSLNSFNISIDANISNTKNQCSFMIWFVTLYFKGLILCYYYSNIKKETTQIFLWSWVFYQKLIQKVILSLRFKRIFTPCCPTRLHTATELLKVYNMMVNNL